MQFEIVSENAFARKVTVTVPADTVRGAIDRALRDFTQRANIPGFRKGKVPRQVVEQRFGPGIANDVAESFIQSGWSKAISQLKLAPVSRPNLVDRGEIKSGAEFRFTIGVEVRPEATLGNYVSLPVQWPASSLDEAEVDTAVERRRQSQARLVAVEDRAVELGDTVQVELEAKEGDTVVLSEPGTLVRTRNDLWLPNLGEFLVGLAIGASKSGPVTFDAGSRNADVAGKTLEVTAKVLSIQAISAPALDEALAKDLGHDSVQALREAVRAELLAGREEGAKNQARANLLQALIDANPVEVPQGMIEQHLSMLVEELKLQNAYRGIDPKDMRFTEEQVADLRMRAQFAARGGLLLEAVARAEKLAIDDAELNERIALLAAERGQSVETVRGWFEKDGGFDELRDRLLEEKTIDWLLSKAEVTHAAPAAAAVEEKPKKASKKKAEAAEPAVEAAPVAEPVAVEEKPKKASKKKAAAEAEEPAAEAAAEPEAKPKKASKKKAAED